ncbi:MAG: sulfotransferase [Cytophagales bacterium]|nr:sulfotransferase [Cytophagales bacterium]
MNRLKLARLLLSFVKRLPRRYPVHSRTEQLPFFILNAGRSGSTLLNRILNEHPKLGLPTEQYFLGPAIFKYHFYNYMIWRDLMQVIVGELWDQRKHTWELDLQAVIREIIDLPKRNRSLVQMVDQLFRHVVDKPRWGDSTPLNVFYYKELYHLYPKAKYIFLIRDGRDVVASYKNGGEAAFGELAQVEESTARWLIHAKAMNWYKQRTQILEVSYEAFMKDPDQQLTLICQFLEIEEMPRDWRNYTEHVPSAEFFEPSHHDAVRSTPFMDSIGKWKSVLSESEAEYCQGIMSAQLKKYGYL